jgi:bifunctional non-homologous end joining protein LigD
MVEFKWDGARIISGVEGGRLFMRTRHGHEVGDRFPELEGIVGTVGNVVLDGELVVLTDDVPDWAAAVRRLRARPAAAAALASRIPAAMMVFDVLRIGGLGRMWSGGRSSTGSGSSTGGRSRRRRPTARRCSQ